MATNDLTIFGNSFDALKFALPNGSVVEFVAATLAEEDDFTRLVPSYPANNGITHHGLRQVSLPTGYLVNIGGSWKASKAEFEPITESVFEVHSTYEIPKTVLKNMSKQQAMALLTANKAAHIMALNQAGMNMILNGPTTPDQGAIVGIMQRSPYTTYDSKSTFSAGGSGNDLRSCWLMKPGIDTLHALHNGFHPTIGIEYEDKGENRVDGLGTSSDEHRYDLVHEFMIQKGIHIEDQRALKRICNVPCGVTDDPGVDLVNAIIEASIVNAPKGGSLMRYNSSGQVVERTKSPWLLMCDERLYAKLVRAQNDKLMVYMSDKNIYRTQMPMIGTDIIICRMDALNHDIGSGETVVAAA